MTKKKLMGKNLRTSRGEKQKEADFDWRWGWIEDVIYSLPTIRSSGLLGIQIMSFGDGWPKAFRTQRRVGGSWRHVLNFYQYKFFIYLVAANQLWAPKPTCPVWKARSRRAETRWTGSIRVQNQSHWLATSGWSWKHPSPQLNITCSSGSDGPGSIWEHCYCETTDCYHGRCFSFCLKTDQGHLVDHHGNIRPDSLNNLDHM